MKGRFLRQERRFLAHYVITHHATRTQKSPLNESSDPQAPKCRFLQEATCIKTGKKVCVCVYVSLQCLYVWLMPVCMCVCVCVPQLYTQLTVIQDDPDFPRLTLTVSQLSHFNLSFSLSATHRNTHPAVYWEQKHTETRLCIWHMRMQKTKTKIKTFSAHLAICCMHFFFPPSSVIVKPGKQGGNWLWRSTVEQKKDLNTRMNHNTQPPPVESVLISPTFEWWRLIHIWVDTFWFEHPVLSYDPLRTQREKHYHGLFS